MRRLFITIFIFCGVSLLSQPYNIRHKVYGTQVRDRINANTNYFKAEIDSSVSRFINVSLFGAVGDGITDDAEAIQDAFDYAHTNGYSVEFDEGKTYISSAVSLNFYGGVLEGNGATIQCTHADDALSRAIKVEGALSAAYSIDGRASAGNTFVDISDATFLASVAVGDMIIIKSDKTFNDDTSNKQGESCIVADIYADRIDVTGKLNDTYLVSDNAVIYLVDAPTPIIRNLNVLQNKDKSIDYWSYGIHLIYCKNPVIDNCNVLWAKFTGFCVNGCYRPIVRNSTASMTIRDGAGYGLQFQGPCTNPYATGCLFNGNRHAVSHGGNVMGAPHNSVIANCTGEAVISSHVFDAHGDAGAVTWMNCTAIGGFNTTEEDEADMIGEWDSVVTYTVGQIVGKGNVLWELVPATSLNEDPLTESVWVYYNNAASGFMCRASNQSIINCSVVNCATGINGYGLTTVVDNFYVDGLFIENCTWGIRIGDGTELASPHFDNITISNKYYKAAPYMIELDDCAITTGYWGKFHGSLIRGIEAISVTDDIRIGELWCHAIGIYMVGDSPSMNMGIRDLNITGIGTGEYNIVMNDFNKLKIDNLNVTGAHTYICSFLGNAVNVSLGKTNSSGDALESILRVYANDTISNLILQEAFIDNTDSIALIRNNGEITTSHIGVYSGDVNTEYNGTRPVLEIVSGDFNSPIISKGLGSPESSVTAGIGSMYHRLDGGANTSLYIKESGTSNTGWIAK